MNPLLSFAMFVPDYAGTRPGSQAPRQPGKSTWELSRGRGINLGTSLGPPCFFTKPPWWRGGGPGILGPAHMKTVVVAAIALLSGLFFGGMGPRAELRRTQKELADAKEAAAQSRSSAALPLALGMGSLMAARDRAQSVPRFQVPDAGPENQPGKGGASAENQPGKEPRRRWFGDGGTEGFAAMKTASDVRATQFRTAFVEEAGLTPAKEQALQTTIDQMNQDFSKAAGEIAEALRTKGQKVRPRDMADIGSKLLDIYRRADDSFSAGLDDDGRRAQGRTQFDILTQVDIGAFKSLAETMEGLGVAQPFRERGR
jgi:hypothetical protein